MKMPQKTHSRPDEGYDHARAMKALEPARRYLAMRAEEFREHADRSEYGKREWNLKAYWLTYWNMHLIPLVKEAEGVQYLSDIPDDRLEILNALLCHQFIDPFYSHKGAV